MMVLQRFVGLILLMGCSAEVPSQTAEQRPEPKPDAQETRQEVPPGVDPVALRIRGHAIFPIAVKSLSFSP
ncbi:MAG: hypothetical protein ACREJB_00445, partial [Planctomycetaceae bacterium]